MAGSPRESLKIIGLMIKHSIAKKLHNEPDSDDESNDDEPTPECAASFPDYHYETLPEPASIRLLKLQPGQPRDPIKCNITPVHLETCRGQYEALSYVWGATEGQLRIQIDDGALKIQPNLHRPLADLRSPEKPRILWIDALCINQSKIEEKNIQTKKTTQKAFAMLQELADEGKVRQANDATTVPSFINRVPINPVQSNLREKYLADVKTMMLAIYIGECEWWSRAWTVQESLLSNNAVMVVGRRSIEWRDLCAAIAHGFNMQIWNPVHFGFVRDEVIVPYLSLRALDNRQRHQQREHSSPAHELLNILIHCRHRDSKDPKDKVYALLGLLHDANFSSADTVYRQVSQQLIENLKNLDVLGVTPKHNLLGLPSWVTDWSVTDYISSPLTRDSLDQDRLTDASKGTTGSLQFLKDGKTIVLNGCELTSVQQLASQLRYMRITSTTMLTPLGTSESELAHEDLLAEAQVPSIIQAGDKSDANSNTRVQLDADAKKVYPQPQESSHMLCRSLKRIHKILQDSKADHTIMHESYKAGINLEDFSNTFRTLFEWENFSRAHATLPSKEIKPSKQTGNPADLYWQTICAGTYQDGSIEQTKAMFDQWSQKLESIRSLSKKHPEAVEKRPLIAVAAYVKSFWRGYSPFWPYIACAKGRRPGRAVNGWLCLLPGASEVGDKIILARGGRVPLVIRPLGDDEGCFSFVGEAYIYGSMDGEAFVEEECKDIRIC